MLINVMDYFKERFIYYLFLLFAFLFAYFVYRFEKKFFMTESNAAYVLAGWFLILTIFFIVDFIMMRRREEKFRYYCNQTSDADPEEIFFFPEDRNKAELVRASALAYARYKAEAEVKAAEET